MISVGIDHWFQSWPPGCLTCIATLPLIALLALSVDIDLVSSSARVTSVKSTKGVGLTEWHLNPKIGPQVYLGPIKTSREHRGKQWWDASLCAMTCFHKFFSWQRRVCDINAFVVTEICLAKFTSVFSMLITGLQNVQNIKCDICLGNL